MIIEEEAIEDDLVAQFDLDGSLANYNKAMLEKLELLRSPHEPPIADLFADEESMPWIRQRKTLISMQPGFWRNLERIEEGFQVFHAAGAVGFQRAILTQCPQTKPLAGQEKIEWINEHCGGCDFDLTRNKGRVFGRMLYDDYIPYVKLWMRRRPRGLVVIPINSQNQKERFEHPNVVWYDGTNLDYVTDCMQAAYVRKSGQPLMLPNRRAA